jgi:hypothetical protein
MRCRCYIQRFDPLEDSFDLESKAQLLGPDRAVEGVKSYFID